MKNECLMEGLSVLLVQNRIVGIENGFQKAHDHESRVADFLEEGDLLGRQVELIHTRKVRVGSGNNAIVVEHNQLLIGDLNDVHMYKRERTLGKLKQWHKNFFESRRESSARLILPASERT
jgi:hypothetical protein